MATLLCFGDSNTWGSDPLTGGRHPREVRWTGVLRAHLPPGWEVIEEGLRGRTALLDDPFEPGRNGLAYLGPCLVSHEPVDLVVLMLGTNDVKRFFPHAAPQVAAGVERLVGEIQRSAVGPERTAPRVLLVAPPPVTVAGPLQAVWGFDAEAVERARALPPYYRAVAEDAGCAFLDAGELIAVSPADGVHLDADAHATLGRAVAERVRALLRA